MNYVCWQEAMAQEICALEDNQIWSIETFPPRKKLISYKWVYKIQRNSNRIIKRYKAQLVAKEYTQVEGLDFHETFALVAKLITVKCLLTIVLKVGIFISLMCKVHSCIGIWRKKSTYGSLWDLRHRVRIRYVATRNLFMGFSKTPTIGMPNIF